jgi:hypothetical protein
LGYSLAMAVFIMANQRAANPKEEDERNTLRLWAIYEYEIFILFKWKIYNDGFVRFAPLTPIYTFNLLQSSASYQEDAATSALCVADLKQVLYVWKLYCIIFFNHINQYIIGLCTLYNGSSTLLSNFIHSRKNIVLP